MDKQRLEQDAKRFVSESYQLVKKNDKQTETVSTGNTDDINQKKEEEDADKQAE